VGGNFACGVDRQGHVQCWGKYDFGQAEPPLALR
jgi:hypothetical protein